MLNQNSLDTVAAALAESMGAQAPAQAAPANQDLLGYLSDAFGGKKADRLFMFNPDAIGQWVIEKYPEFLKEALAMTDLKLPLCAVMPSVTPVCFATMYTGAQPEIHGIKSYRKPVLQIETLFDALIKAGKKCAIVADDECSIGKIFLEREMDYFIFQTTEEVNAKAAELIIKDEYDMICVYNSCYDSIMHKNGPEAAISLGALMRNSHTFAIFSELIKAHWKDHNSISGFAMDHGCHEIDGGCGSHGLDMPEDLNIMHLYKAYPAK